MFSTSQTLILLTRNSVARVDVSGGRGARVRGAWQQPRVDSYDLGTLVDVGLRLGGGRPKRVWVLSAEFWTGSVVLPAEVVSAAGEDDLLQTVLLESETYSGISAFDSVGGFRLLEAGRGERTYWVTQLPSSDFAEIEQAVAARGARLDGVAHPALSGALEPRDQDRPWNQVQLWDEAAVLARGTGAQTTRLRVVTGDPLSGSVEAEWDAWRSDTPDTSPTVLDATGRWSPPDGMRNAEVLRLDAPDVLGCWALRWLADVDRDPTTVPWFRPAKKPMSSQRQGFLAAAFALAALLLAVGHYRLEQSRMTGIDQQLAELKSQSDQTRVRQKEVEDARKKAEELRKEEAALVAQIEGMRSDVRSAAGILEGHRWRWQHLLDQLARHSSGEPFVQQIHAAGTSVEIRGYSTTSGAANAFANRLALSLEEHGWRVMPPKLAQQENRLYEFRLQIDPREFPPGRESEEASEAGISIARKSASETQKTTAEPVTP